MTRSRPGDARPNFIGLNRALGRSPIASPSAASVVAPAKNKQSSHVSYCAAETFFFFFSFFFSNRTHSESISTPTEKRNPPARRIDPHHRRPSIVPPPTSKHQQRCIHPLCVRDAVLSRICFNRQQFPRKGLVMLLESHNANETDPGFGTLSTCVRRARACAGKKRATQTRPVTPTKSARSDYVGGPFAGTVSARKTLTSFHFNPQAPGALHVRPRSCTKPNRIAADRISNPWGFRRADRVARNYGKGTEIYKFRKSSEQTQSTRRSPTATGSISASARMTPWPAESIPVNHASGISTAFENHAVTLTTAGAEYKEAAQRNSLQRTFGVNARPGQANQSLHRQQTRLRGCCPRVSSTPADVHHD